MCPPISIDQFGQGIVRERKAFGNTHTAIYL